MSIHVLTETKEHGIDDHLVNGEKTVCYPKGEH